MNASKYILSFISVFSAIAILAGCTSAEEVTGAFRKMQRDEQKQFESDAAFAARQPLITVTVPMADTSETPDGREYVQLRWAYYDANTGVLRLEVPVSEPLHLASLDQRRWTPTRHLHIYDDSLKTQPAQNASLTLNTEVDAEKQLNNFQWRAQFQSNIGRSSAFDTARVHLRKIELLYGGKMVWAYTPPTIPSPIAVAGQPISGQP